MQIVLVAAIGENDVIGRDGQLPWRLKSDLAHFRALTVGKPVIMGRKTYVSIGKPLKDRTNIVLTRDAGWSAPGTVPVASMEAATMPMAGRLEITHVHASPQGDALFPPIDPTMWAEVSRVKHAAGPDDDADFSVVTYSRR
jgi:dihydrofolate reductase